MSRELPDFARKRAHETLDELLDRYERGELLWILQHFSWYGTGIEPARLDMTIKEYRS